MKPMYPTYMQPRVSISHRSFRLEMSRFASGPGVLFVMTASDGVLLYAGGQAARAAHVVGQWGCQGRSRSKARAAWRTRSSRWRGPTIWRPIGRPARERPRRTVAAGCHERLNGIVKEPTFDHGCGRPSVSVG